MEVPVDNGVTKRDTGLCFHLKDPILGNRSLKEKNPNQDEDWPITCLGLPMGGNPRSNGFSKPTEVQSFRKKYVPW